MAAEGFGVSIVVVVGGGVAAVAAMGGLTWCLCWAGAAGRRRSCKKYGMLKCGLRALIIVFG